MRFQTEALPSAMRVDLTDWSKSVWITGATIARASRPYHANAHADKGGGKAHAHARARV
jgi:hypothetical protein